ncbi:MAG: hypothetical protein ACIAQZ_14795 [Sedimentisphaeraceae bacterium JB056]
MEIKEQEGLDWKLRAHSAAQIYKRFESFEPGLLTELIKNLHLWASILPQVYDDIGIYHPVNSSGLSPEVTELSAIIDELILNGSDQLANCLQNKLQSLQESASMLDQVYPIHTNTQRFEELRLTDICQRKAELLCSYLYKLKERLFEIASSEKIDLPDQKQEKMSLSEVPWEDIEICFIDGHTVSIKADNKSQIYTYVQMSMSSKHNGHPTKQWLLLEAFAQTGGRISWKDPQSNTNLRKQKQLLSRILKDFFCKETDPIDWLREQKCYCCRFGISIR